MVVEQIGIARSIFALGTGVPNKVASQYTGDVVCVRGWHCLDVAECLF